MLYLTVASVGGRAASFTVTSPARTLNLTLTPSLALNFYPSQTLTLTLTLPQPPHP